MKGFRVSLALGLALVALAGRGARADGDQSDIISAHGDALSRATSAEALVRPMPSLPPNSAPPVIPSAEAPLATPEPARKAVMPAASASPTGAPPTQPAAVTDTNSASKPAPPPEVPQGLGRAALIAAGALIALAMFLWERRRKD